MSYEVLTETVEIDGETYEIRLLDAIAGAKLYAKLLSAFGGALKGLGKVDPKNPDEIALPAIGTVLSSLTPELFEELRATFARATCLVKDGKRPELKDVFMTHFRGRYGHMSKWMLACLKANFADFLGDSSTGKPGLITDLLSKFVSMSPKPSTGSSTVP